MACLCVVSRTATWGTCSAHASSSKEDAPTTRWNTARPCCPAVLRTPTPCSPILLPSAATVVPARPTAMSVHTGPAWTEPVVPNQSNASTRLLTSVTLWSLSDPPDVLISAFCHCTVYGQECMKLNKCNIIFTQKLVMFCRLVPARFTAALLSKMSFRMSAQ